MFFVFVVLVFVRMCVWMCFHIFWGWCFLTMVVKPVLLLAGTAVNVGDGDTVLLSSVLLEH